MNSPLYNAFGNGNNNNMNGLIQQFNQFKQTFKGDPRSQLQSMLNSGQLSQERFNQLRNYAEQIQRMLK